MFAQTSTMPLATHFSNVTEALLQDYAVVVPPYEGKNSTPAWVRGSIRLRGPGVMEDLVVTAPSLKVVFSGCRWNRLVMAAPSEHDPSYEFVQWIRTLGAYVESTIFAAPDKYKPGAKNAVRFTFDLDVLKASSEPTMYPDEIRTRLSTIRRPSPDDPEAFLDTSNAILMNQEGEPIEPADILAGGTVMPIIKVSYYRNVDRFGLVFTVLKALYTAPPDRPQNDNASYEFDTPMDV